MIGTRIPLQTGFSLILNNKPSNKKMKESIIQFIKSEISNNKLEDFHGDEMLFDSGIIDSLGIMRLVSFIEKESQKKIPYQDLTVENFSTVNRIVDYLSRDSY
tara:strand:+ start:43 stop:351 length:309 start_codon:yes stop_codon:yes gene_type:complete